MKVLNTDLLPPLFDQVLMYYGEVVLPGQYLRSDIIKALQNSIINATAEEARTKARLPGYTKPNNDHFELKTFDRLSGDHISRAALSEELQELLSLNRLVVEIALLFVEAQIDFRLQAGSSFKLAGIEFAVAPQSGGQGSALQLASKADIAAWCQGVLPLTLQGATSDVPTIWNRKKRHLSEGLRVLVESLQLCATFREAVPYLIKVDSRLVDSLLMDARQDEHIRLLHISDLHLVEDLTDPNRGGSTTLGQIKHNFAAARLLGRAVDSLRPGFDVLVATGDLTTDGTQGAFETVLQYIQSGPISGENKMRIATFGLNAGRGRRILLPGNHDRFEGGLIPGQRLSNLFENILGIERQYPYVVGYQPSNQPGKSDGPPLTLLFFVFDSNLPEGSRHNNIVKDRIDSIAQGYISDEDTSQLGNLAKQAADKKRVLGLDGKEMEFEPRNTIRIALLHHHPVAEKNADEARDRRKSAPFYRWVTNPSDSIKDRKLAFDKNAMKLEGAARFLEQCLASGIQLILFGHQHFQYRRVISFVEKQDHFIRAFCCPTTLEKYKHGNGFYVFDFLDKKTFSIDFYVSAVDVNNKSMPFSRIAEKSGQFDFAKLSPGESEFLYKMNMAEQNNKVLEWE
ncbi:MAG: metallophosphoesterase [Methylococcaceae bacterium]